MFVNLHVSAANPTNRPKLSILSTIKSNQKKVKLSNSPTLYLHNGINFISIFLQHLQIAGKCYFPVTVLSKSSCTSFYRHMLLLARLYRSHSPPNRCQISIIKLHYGLLRCTSWCNPRQSVPEVGEALC